MALCIMNFHRIINLFTHAWALHCVLRKPESMVGMLYLAQVIFNSHVQTRKKEQPTWRTLLNDPLLRAVDNGIHINKKRDNNRLLIVHRYKHGSYCISGKENNQLCTHAPLEYTHLSRNLEISSSSGSPYSHNHHKFPHECRLAMSGA